MALCNYRKIDVGKLEGRRKLIDTFVNSVFLYDDHLKIIYNGSKSWKVRNYPKSVSHGYHILYKECASKYNIWFLLYMAIFTLPQIGERIGVKTRTKF